MKNYLARKTKGKKIILAMLVAQTITIKKAYAALPWEGPLETVVESLTGPVAQGIAVIAVVVTGGMLAFGELNGMAKRLMMILFGLSLALSASSFIMMIGG